jgi:hypothetical protein
LPGASTAPATSTRTCRQVGAVKQGSNTRTLRASQSAPAGSAGCVRRRCHRKDAFASQSSSRIADDSQASRDDSVSIGRLTCRPMSDPVIEQIEAFQCRRGSLTAERRNRGYTLYNVRSGAPVARLRPTDTEAASTCSIGRSGSNDGLPPDRSAQPNSRSTGHSSSSLLKTSSGRSANRLPGTRKCAKSN